MKQNELRIGNWISDQGYETTVFQIDETHVNDDLMLDHFKPIPLTEEWLVRFGFYYEDGLIYFKSGWFKKIDRQDEPTFLFFNNKLQCSLFISSEKSSINHFIDINAEYVHQLQNLYFALTGNELELK